MSKHHQINVTFIETGSLIDNLHYGIYSRYQWEFSSFSTTQEEQECDCFSIRIGQKTHAFLNNRDFYIIIKICEEKNIPLLQYLYEYEEITSITSSASAAVSNVYALIFKTKTRYLGPIVIGWNDKNIIQELSKNVEFFPILVKIRIYSVFIYQISSLSQTHWQYGGSNYKASLIHLFSRKPAIYLSKIEDELCKIEIYQDSQLQKTYIGLTPDNV